MKIAIIGDVHIGQSNFLGFVDPGTQINTRLADLSETLNKIIDYIKIHNIKHVIFLGDYYKSRCPSNLHRRIFTSKIKELSDLGVLTMLITGNHDIVAENKSTVLDDIRVAEYPNVKIYTEFNYSILGQIEEEANIIFAPFSRYHDYNVKDNAEAINKIKEKINNILSCLDTSLPTILVGHYAVEGVDMGAIKANVEDDIGQIVIPKNIFSNIDLTVMGHIHKKQVVSKDPHIIYAGSIDRNNFSEIENKGFIELDTDKMEATFINVPVRDIRDITVSKNYAEQLESMVLKNSIVRIHVKCNKEDLHEVDYKIIEKILKNKQVFHCVNIDVITEEKEGKLGNPIESMSDQEIFIDYVKKNFNNSDAIISRGLDIMFNNLEEEL